MGMHIDFAFSSFRSNSFPQGGLLLFRRNNRTWHLLNEWGKNIEGSDQNALHLTLSQFAENGDSVNVYLLNNRYNVRVWERNRGMKQMLYPNNKMLMVHTRDCLSDYFSVPTWSLPNPLHSPSNYQTLCDALQKYDDVDEEHYVYELDRHCQIGHCFQYREPKCNHSEVTIKEGSPLFDPKKWTKEDSECRGQWNVNVNFVPLQQNKCPYLWGS